MSMRCLLVDDSIRFLEAARSLLERDGIPVVGVALSGTEALVRAAELTPDVVLVDLDLDGESGFDVAARLARSVSAVIILISTHALEDFEELIMRQPGPRVPAQVGAVGTGDQGAAGRRRHDPDRLSRRVSPGGRERIVVRPGAGRRTTASASAFGREGAVVRPGVRRRSATSVVGTRPTRFNAEELGTGNDGVRM